ncbi:hypothetical protein SteCoe_25065 [Stentor coeruleus]|uniref:Uncharacterized protein n=1 Tax=Stentor coeruleus TaxID=5963 RepID=A0A1R2BG26_9CILI|nr:hypothetical protein SteCoe_25065 [Stentor coeruleus]
MNMVNNSPMLPQLRVNKSKEITLEPFSQRSRYSPIPIIQRESNSPQNRKSPKLKQNSQSHSCKPKINTNLKQMTTQADFQDIKFESIKWSGNSILNPGFFNIPNISPPSNLPRYFPRITRPLSISKNYGIPEIEKIDEIPQFRKTGLKKFPEIKSPWTFQPANYIIPNEE